MKFPTACLMCATMLMSGNARASYSDVATTVQMTLPASANATELPESSPSSPPLSTDDPGTPGPHGVEINLSSSGDFSRSHKAVAGGVDLNFGIGQFLQLRIEKEAVYESSTDVGRQSSLGSTDLGLKWRFYDNGDLKLAFYPSYDFDDAVQKREGRSIYLPIIVAKTFKRYTVIFNAGLRKNFDHWDSAANFASVSVGRGLGQKTRLMTELTTQLANAERQNEVRLGIVREIFPHRKSGFAKAVFGSVGRSVGPTADGDAHTSLMMGLAFAKGASG